MAELVDKKGFKGLVTFDEIKHINSQGEEFWYARELQIALDYTQWRKFEGTIEKAKNSCKASGNRVTDHFAGAGKMVQIGSGAKRKQKDYKLSRYACYLIAMNGDSRKETIATAQTYFAIQTRKQEIKDEASNIEVGRRLFLRSLTRKGNYNLNQAAKNSGVKNFDKFHNAGYRGLYNGESANDIAKRKGLRYREDILDNMGSTELAANLFRITQAEERLNQENINTETSANETHFEVGKNVRETMIKNGTTMPEDMPTPEKSLKQLEKENKQKYVDSKQ